MTLFRLDHWNKATITLDAVLPNVTHENPFDVAVSVLCAKDDQLLASTSIQLAQLSTLLLARLCIKDQQRNDA